MLTERHSALYSLGIKATPVSVVLGRRREGLHGAGASRNFFSLTIGLLVTEPDKRS